MNEKLIDFFKFIITLIGVVVATIAWMDNRFITVAEAKDYVKIKRVEKLERIITFQELQSIWKSIEQEEKKEPTKRNKEKLKIYYEQENKLKSELGVK